MERKTAVNRQLRQLKEELSSHEAGVLPISKRDLTNLEVIASVPSPSGNVYHCMQLLAPETACIGQVFDDNEVLTQNSLSTVPAIGTSNEVQ